MLYDGTMHFRDKPFFHDLMRGLSRQKLTLPPTLSPGSGESCDDVMNMAKDTTSERQSIITLGEPMPPAKRDAKPHDTFTV